MNSGTVKYSEGSGARARVRNEILPMITEVTHGKRERDTSRFPYFRRLVVTFIKNLE